MSKKKKKIPRRKRENVTFSENCDDFVCAVVNKKIYPTGTIFLNYEYMKHKHYERKYLGMYRPEIMSETDIQRIR